ncbi:MAG: B12-binding domain-containing radical SAM protein [Candidatus Bruticola sp.]
MKILLINPPRDNSISSEVPTTVNAETNTIPPLGLMYLEAHLHKYSQSEVRIVDCLADHLHSTHLRKIIADYRPQVVGITGHTHDLIDMMQTSQIAKEELGSRVRIFWGGPHVSDFPAQCMKYSCVDGCIPFEGEEAFTEVVAAHTAAWNEESGYDSQTLANNLQKINGIYFKNEQQQIVQTPTRPPIADLDSLPFPRREILDYRKYSYVLGSEAVATSLLTSRGCPYKCSFCNTPGRTTWRWRSAESVVDELAECAKLGVHEVYIVDDTFNVRQDRVLAICSEIKKRSIKVNWNIRARANCITPETVKAMRSAGCTRVHIGVESGTDEGMKALNKNLTTAKVRQAFNMLTDEGLTTVCYFMIGCPHDSSLDEINKTVDFAISLDPDYALFGILTPYPNTLVYNQGIEKGILDPNHWDQFLANPYPNFKPQVWTEFFSAAELSSLCDQAFKRFYLRPKQMFRKLLELKNFHDMARKLKAGWEILKL